MRISARPLRAAVLPWLLLLALAVRADPASPEPAAACTPEALASPTLAAPDYLRCTRALLNPPAGSALPSTDALYDAMLALAQRDFTRPASDDVEALHLLAAELERRRAMRPLERRLVVDVLLLNGRIEEAEVAKLKVGSRRSLVLPRLQPLASPAPAGLQRYWTWDTDANVLMERTVDLSRGQHVVVSSSVGCHFSDAFSSALPKDAALARAFGEHALWISRPDSGFDLGEVTAWNAKHPATPLMTVFDLSGWPHPAPWSTPFFYFLRDGQLVTTVRGYEPGRIDEIREGFKLIGVALDPR